MPLVDILMFSEQNEGTESFIGTWLKQPGEHVNAHEPVVEISTDKVTVEVAAPQSGTLMEILRNENDPVAPGDVLGRIETASNEVMAAAPVASALQSSSAPPPPAAPADPGALTPAVKRLLAENNLEASQVPATGRGGRITHQDVLDYLQSRKATPQAAKPGTRLVPHTPMRRSIANHMARSLQSAPHVTALFEADLSRVLADRAKLPNAPTLTAYLVQAAVEALLTIPEANSRWHDDHLEIFEDINIGVGTATADGGLIVPVIHKAQSLSLHEISDQLRSLTKKARDGALTRSDVEGGTFTISNHGVSGSLLAAPIVIPNSQAAVLGAGKLHKRPVADQVTDEIRVKPMMYVTLTIDHRILDGQQTNAFLTKFVSVLENESASAQ